MAFDMRKFKDEAEKEVMDEVDKGLDDLSDLAFADALNIIDVINHTTDTGFLAGTAKVEREYLKKTIVFPAPYAACIEFGTRPHWPPVDALIGWVRRKLKVNPSEVNQVAFKIVRKIAKKGTPPQPFLRPALNKYVSMGLLKYELVVGSAGGVRAKVGGSFG